MLSRIWETRETYSSTRIFAWSVSECKGIPLIWLSVWFPVLKQFYEGLHLLTFGKLFDNRI